ncbi:hypothetical protein AB3N59_15455 [Leptospira sp. WS92.C1]
MERVLYSQISSVTKPIKNGFDTFLTQVLREFLNHQPFRNAFHKKEHCTRADPFFIAVPSATTT